jgi:hypothetical protein
MTSTDKKDPKIAKDSYHVVVVLLGAGTAQVESFNTKVALVARLKELIEEHDGGDSEVMHLLPFYGDRYQISTGPYYYLRDVDDRSEPLFTIPTAVETTYSDDGFIGEVSGEWDKDDEEDAEEFEDEDEEEEDGYGDEPKSGDDDDGDDEEEFEDEDVAD